MIRAELLKLRLQRTPQVLLGLAVAALAITVAVTAGQDPLDLPTQYLLRASNAVFLLLPVLAGILGGFVMGSEYRQDTLKRLAAIGPRRGRIVATKLGVLLGTIVAAALVLYGLSLGAMALIASSKGVGFPWGRVWPELTMGLVYASALGVLAFGLSLITRSDVFAMIGTIGIPLVFDTAVSALAESAGRFTFTGALDGTLARLPQLGDPVSTPLLGPVGAAAVLAAWLLVPLAVGTRRFTTTDI